MLRLTMLYATNGHFLLQRRLSCLCSISGAYTGGKNQVEIGRKVLPLLVCDAAIIAALCQ